MDSFGTPGKNKVLVLEHVGYLSVPFLLFYHMRGYRICYLDMMPGIREWSWIRKGEENGSFRKITYYDFGLIPQLAINNRSIKEIGGIYQREMRGCPAFKILENLYGSGTVHYAFTKYFLYVTFHLNRLEFILRNLRREFPGGEVLLIPGPSYLQLRTFQLYREFLRGEGVKVPPLASGTFYLYSLLQKMGYLIPIWLFPLWILAKVRLPARERPDTRQYLLGMRIYSTDYGFARHYQNIDFLVDGGRITRENTLFCLEERISQEYHRALDGRGYRSASVDDALHHASFAYLRETVLGRFLPSWTAMALHALSEPPLVLRIWLESSMKYLKWTAFLEKYRFTHYVVNNDLIPLNTLRNVLLSSRGTRTWMFVHSCSNNDLITPPGTEDIQEKYFSYFYYDNFVVWGRKMEDYYASHPNAIGHFERTGCLWSEFARNLGEAEGERPLLARAREKFAGKNGSIPKKIIAVFDTTFGFDCPLAYQDLILFAEDILGLLSENADTGVIFKNKLSMEELARMEPRLLPSYRALRDHPRVFLTEKEFADSAEAIAVSDLVISVGFTSPTIEALGARRRAMYHDPSGAYRGTFYDRIPGFVSHSYTELLELSRYWMREATDEAFGNFLDTRVKGDLDFAVDGRGITRFREALAEVSHEPPPVG